MGKVSIQSNRESNPKSVNSLDLWCCITWDGIHILIPNVFNVVSMINLVESHHHEKNPSTNNQVREALGCAGGIVAPFSYSKHVIYCGIKNDVPCQLDW